ncbi:MAG: transporter ATP-binding protein [Bacillales bacterium]|jgi:ABC-2 type transport system ATP-binding protein|nr:transporter ATP-binding protein [Bacillales bacterium]
MSSILSVENLTKMYKSVCVLNNVSFEIKAGSVVGLLGPNGAGKTTTMKIIMDLIPKTTGRIHYDNKTRIIYLQDVPEFYDFYQVKEYLKFILELNQFKGDIKSKIEETVKLVGLEAELNKRIKSLSRGLRQRLGIASSIIMKPDVLILDEPVSALDPIGRKEVFDLIGQLKGKMSIIFSSHILSDIERICDHVILLDKGSILLNKSISDIQLDDRVLVIEFNDVETLRIFSDEWKETLEIKEKTISITTKNLTQSQNKVFEILHKKGLMVESVHLKKINLEDIFLKEVGVKNE